MRIATVEIGGVKYPAAYSLGVLRDVEARMGKPASEALDALSESNCITDTVWLLAQLLRAGAEVTHAEKQPPGEDDIYNLVGIDEIYGITAQVLGTTHTVYPMLEIEAKKPMAKLRRAFRTLFG